MTLQKKSESHASDQAPQKEVPAFRMGETAEQTPRSGKASLKTRLIRNAGGYGGFTAKYGTCAFSTTQAACRKLVSRNSPCFCGSKKKFKKCCMNG